MFDVAAEGEPERIFWIKLNPQKLERWDYRIVGIQLQAFIDEHSLLPSSQSAYRRCHSTEAALAKVYSDLVQAMNSGNQAVLALLDMTTAFDAVDHEILLERMRRSYGVSGSAVMPQGTGREPSFPSVRVLCRHPLFFKPWAMGRRACSCV